MGYLSITSKPELGVRDRIAWALCQKYPDRVVAREFTISCAEKAGLRQKKVDVAILGADLTPELLIEFKAMIVPDTLTPKIHDHIASLADDLRRIAEICATRAIGVMLMVDIPDVQPLLRRGLDDRIVKYLEKFEKAGRTPEPFERAVRRVQSYYQEVGLTTSVVISDLPSIWETPVRLASFILQ